MKRSLSLRTKSCCFWSSLFPAFHLQGFFLFSILLDETPSEHNFISLLSLPLSANPDLPHLFSLLLESRGKPLLLRAVFTLLEKEDPRETETASEVLNSTLKLPYDALVTSCFQETLLSQPSPNSRLLLSKRLLHSFSLQPSEALLFSPLPLLALEQLQDDPTLVLQAVFALLDLRKGEEKKLLAFLAGTKIQAILDLQELLACSDVSVLVKKIETICANSANRAYSAIMVRFVLHYSAIPADTLISTIFPEFATLLSMDETHLREWIENHPFFGSVSASTFILFQEYPYDPILTNRAMADPILYPLPKRRQLLLWPVLSLSSTSTADEFAAVETLLASAAISLPLSAADVERVLGVLQQATGEAGLLLALRLLSSTDASKLSLVQQQAHVVLMVGMEW